MTTAKKIFLASLLVVAATGLSGCIKVQTGSNTAATTADMGGIFMSDNKGVRWRSIASMPTVTGAPKSFSAVDIESFASDPSDDNAFYLGSVDNSIFYTYDSGETWQLAKSLGQVTVDAIAVDPKSKCTIYASVANKLMKSTDCTRTWKAVFQDNSGVAKIYAIAIDHHDPENILIGVSAQGRGDLLRSSDAGGSWRVVENFKDTIKKIAVHPTDSRKNYLITAKKGAFKSTDKGEKWTEMASLSKTIKDSGLKGDINDLVVMASSTDTLFLSTVYGIVRSNDGGENWEKIEILTPEKQAAINSIAVNKSNQNEIYYVTNSTFYRSGDGGVNWSTMQVPSSRRAWKIIIHPKKPDTIYLVFKSLPKK